MAPLWILKTGSAVPSVLEQHGDFEAWFARGMGVPVSELRVCEVHKGEALPDAREARAVLITGSVAMVTDRAEWSERTAAWLRDAADAGAVMLGVCYGHQLLAHAFGGVVANNPRGRNIGTVDVRLQPDAAHDALLGAMPEQMHVPVSHLQSVIELPKQARRLASTARDPNHAFAIGDRVWGVQFHPEFTADIVKGYIRARRDALANEGLDAQALHDSARDTEHGPSLLRRFRELTR